MTEATTAFFKKAVEKMDISARGYHKLLRVARTIADMDMCKKVEIKHIAEAMQYRLLKL
jgi:magnesium chelatase family protein